MSELLSFIKHIIILINDYKDFFEAILDFVSIIVGIITGVSLIIGLGYLKTYREKTSAATFTFWSQIRIRINEISTILKTDNSLINNLYSVQLRLPSEAMSERIINVQIFKEKIQQIINYIEKTPDQMPAYKGWTDDYSKFTDFLYDTIIYDICNPNDWFKFSNETNNIDRTEYCKEICQVMDTLCNKIKDRQTVIEKKMYKK